MIAPESIDDLEAFADGLVAELDGDELRLVARDIVRAYAEIARKLRDSREREELLEGALAIVTGIKPAARVVEMIADDVLDRLAAECAHPQQRARMQRLLAEKQELLAIARGLRDQLEGSK